MPAALLVAALAACRLGTEGPPVGRLRLPVTVAPALAALRVGDSAAVGMTFVPGPRPETLVWWTSDAPQVAWVDTTARRGVTGARAPVVVHARGPGAAIVTVVVVDGGETITGTVPVTVTARPTA